MAPGCSRGGRSRWTGVYVALVAVVLLFTLTLIYMETVHVQAAVARFTRDAAVARSVRALPYATLINTTAAQHRLNPALIAAIVMAESGFDARARSARGAYGLMQVMPATWREIDRGLNCAAPIARMTSPPCMMDPAANLEVGAIYLRRLVDRFGGDTVLAVAAYNAGAGEVIQHGGVPPFPETTRYLRQVALAWFHLQRDGTLTPFWRHVVRSLDTWLRVRTALLIGLGAVALHWLWMRPARAIAPGIRR
jgi:soluble lytic murein transglycosylase-like protein